MQEPAPFLQIPVCVEMRAPLWGSRLFARGLRLDSRACHGRYASPRVRAELEALGWKVMSPPAPPAKAWNQVEKPASRPLSASWRAGSP